MCNAFPLSRHAVEITPFAVKAPDIPALSIKTVDVESHIRNLPDGWHPSAEKIFEAEKLGILLAPGQTLVDSYTKEIAA